MMRKGLLLFLALLLPVIIFLFLHSFGKNEFEVPILFQTAEELPANCGLEASLPYQVQSDKVDVTEGAIVLFSSGLSNAMFDDALFQLRRVKDEFDVDAPEIIVVKKSNDQSPKVENEMVMNAAEYEQEQQCVFLAGTNQIVLIDAEGHIRGLYSNASLKEIDRLILELKIILNKY
ncbi:MAG TPA: hypothetical protein PK185_12445 [Cyclobacteriaceae bacterium]|nr:hypothetical protein [Cyclobacteriaceae bacterium]